MFDSKTLHCFSRVVESIYDAALEPARWPDTVAHIAHLHGSDKALLFTPILAPGDGGFAFPHGISETAMLDWGSRYIQHDLWTREGMGRDLAPGEAVIDTDLVPDDTLLESVFYREFLSHHDIRRLCTGMVFDATSANVPMTGCSIYGALSSSPFEEINRQLHRLTLNHLSKSLGTMLRLRDTELRLASTLSALDRLTGAIVLLGNRGHVLFANDAALKILAASDGLALRSSLFAGSGLGVLHASRPYDQALLQHRIQEAVAADPLQSSHFNQGLKLQRPSGRHPLVLQLAPLSERSELAHADRQAYVIGFITDLSERIRLDAGLLDALYGLTPAETRLAGELLMGDALPAIATRLGVGASTVKSHLKSLFAKTATHRQADLVKLLMSLSVRKST